MGRRRPLDIPPPGPAGSNPLAEPPDTSAYAWNGPVGHGAPDLQPVVSGGDGSEAAPQQRTLNINSTVLEQVIPCVFGERIVAGMMGDYNSDGATYLIAQYVFSQGEQGGSYNGIPQIWVNDELIWENNARVQVGGVNVLDWISRVAVYPGSISQAADAALLGAFGADHTAYPGICYCVLTIDTNRIDSDDPPSGLQVKAKLAGRKCLDFRTSTSVVSTNPVVIAHEILTATDCFLGIPTARFDTAAVSTWDTIADWCDVTVGTTKRYQFAAPINVREAWEAVASVLAHCFTTLFLSGGLVKMWAYRTQTETGVHIGADIGDWLGRPRTTPTNEGTIPDIVEVRWITPAGEPISSKFVRTPAPAANEFRKVEATREGFWLSAQAIRWGQHHHRCVDGDRLTVEGECGAKAAPLEPGDIVRITAPGGPTNELMRIHEKTDLKEGVYRIKAVEYTGSIEPTQDPEDGARPTQTTRAIAAPPSPTDITLTWYRNRDRRTTNSDDAVDWDQTSDKIVVTADTEVAPDGNTVGDDLDNDGFEDQIQNVDAIVDDFPGSTFFQLCWIKTDGDEFDLELGSELTGSGYHGMVRVRNHWRLFRQISTKSGSPKSGPAIKFAGTEPVVQVAAAIGWPDSQEDRTHDEWFEMTWTPHSAAESCNRYELQYRTWDLDKSTVSAWKTHAAIPRGASRISWGDRSGTDAQHFPAHWVTGNGMTGEVLYDWRLVVIRRGQATELIPTTVAEVEVGRTLTVYQSDDVNMAGIANRETLVWDTATGKFVPGDATDLGADYLHGFESRTDSTLAFDKSTQVFTLGEATPSVWFAYWYKGQRVLIPETTLDLNDFTLAEGLWYIYFEDATGVPTASQTMWSIIDHVPIATVFWNGTDGAVGDERHGYRRDLQWHAWAHMSVGARYQSGLAMTAPSPGSYSTVDFSAGTLWDEDIQLSIAQQTDCRIFYLTGASTYTWEDSARAHLWSGAAVQYIDTDTYAKTALSGGQRINTWIYGSNDTDRALYVFVEARSAPHATTAQARNVTPPDLSAFGLTPELKLLYRCIWGATSLEEVTDYRNSASLPAGGTSPTAATNVTVAPAGNIAATNVQAALEELDTEKQAAGNYLGYRASGTKSGFDLTGTAFEIATWTMPTGHDGGKLHIEVGVSDATDDRYQGLASEWMWQMARRAALPAITVYQLGTPSPADPNGGTLTVTLDVTSLGSIKVAVTSSLSGGSAPVGNLTWWMTGTGVATLTPA